MKIRDHLKLCGEHSESLLQWSCCGMASPVAAAAAAPEPSLLVMIVEHHISSSAPFHFDYGSFELLPSPSLVFVSIPEMNRHFDAAPPPTKPPTNLPCANDNCTTLPPSPQLDDILNHAGSQQNNIISVESLPITHNYIGSVSLRCAALEFNHKMEIHGLLISDRQGNVGTGDGGQRRQRIFLIGLSFLLQCPGEQRMID